MSTASLLISQPFLVIAMVEEDEAEDEQAEHHAK